MYKNQRIAVVVPAHNEARHIGGVVADVPEFVDYIIVVNDFILDIQESPR